MTRIVSLLVLALTLVSVLEACAVEVEGGRRCRYGWEPAHRDRRGRVIPGHCR